MITTHNLGYPRIGLHRELKSACERYWSGRATLDELNAVGKRLRAEHWREQQRAGIDLIPCNDFSFYDHVLDMTLALGAVPSRYAPLSGGLEAQTYFAMARGRQDSGLDVTAMEMTKWFDTNYHYIVPEFAAAQAFRPGCLKAVDEFKEASALGINAKPVILGPVSYLLLGKEKERGFHRIDLLERLLPAYIDLLRGLEAAGAKVIQVDEPFLAMDLEEPQRAAYRTAYARLREALRDLRIIVATYFGGLRDNISLALGLPVYALHVDLVRAPGQLDDILAAAPAALVLSLGLVDGRNPWKNDLTASLALVDKAIARLGAERVMVAPSCSLLHVPHDLALESDAAMLPGEVRNWLAFARQKLDEVKTIAGLAAPDTHSRYAGHLANNILAVEQRRNSKLIHRPEVKARAQAVTPADLRRGSAFAERQRQQRSAFKLPLFPTTTIGSFPQTVEVRRLRARLQEGAISEEDYEAALEHEVDAAIRWQEEIGMDVLVHGEFERNDMVQYFGEQLEGCAFMQHGWVQSYGSRCVRPPIIYGDVARKAPMTVRWSAYAQSRTRKPVKGMLTGPVTCHPRGLAAAPRRPGRLPALGGRQLPAGLVRSARRDADPHPHVLRGIQRHHGRDRRHGRRCDHHRDFALADGASRGVQGLPLSERDRAGSLRYPLATHTDPRRDGRSPRARAAIGAQGAPLGESGLWPQDPRLAGNKIGAAEHDRGGRGPARSREALRWGLTGVRRARCGESTR